MGRFYRTFQAVDFSNASRLIPIRQPHVANLNWANCHGRLVQGEVAVARAVALRPLAPGIHGTDASVRQTAAMALEYIAARSAVGGSM
jgi:hypothetical protein